MKNLIMDYDAFSIWRIIGKTELKKLSRLVIDVNYKHHLNQLSFSHEEFERIYQEDVKALPDSRFYGIYDRTGEIIAAVKCQKWNYSINSFIRIKSPNMYRRNYLYINGENQERIKNFHILIGGCGLGSVIAECALRLGFENICKHPGIASAQLGLGRQCDCN